MQITTTLTDKSEIQAVLAKAAGNFTRLLTSPDGPAKATFASPLMPLTAANACELLLASDVTSLFGEEASPIVGEALTTAVGVINFRNDKNSERNFVTHDCERGAPGSEADAFSFNTRAVKLEATTYRDVEGAKEHMLFHKARDKKVTAPSQKVGDEAIFSAGFGGIQEELMVRKGQIILEFSNQAKQGTKDQLTTLARTVGRSALRV